MHKGDNNMFKSVFRIAQMDCPSEEQMIRMKLDGIADVKRLDFDIHDRKLTVYHANSTELVLERLNSLQLGTSLLGRTEIDDFVIAEGDTKNERRLLWQVLAINFTFFILELITGFVSNSISLVADSLDMLADSFIYGLALFAVGGTMARKKQIARAAGIFQLILAVAGFIEVIRRFTATEAVPDFITMIIISALALAGNSFCLYLLQKSRSKEIHMKASMIFTANDVIINIGVICAALLVYITQSKYPDLIIGTIVFLIVGRGAINIFKLSR